jgi:hypothetical protein
METGSVMRVVAVAITMLTFGCCGAGPNQDSRRHGR